ncbi:MAG: FG-GAP repeat protein [Lacipirellulaceae bacterium]
MDRSVRSLSLLALSVLVIPSAKAQPFRYVQTLTASDTADGDLFGTLVDLDGDIAIVRSRAAYGEYETSPQTHVFEFSAGQFVETDIIAFPDLFQDGGFYTGQESAIDNGVIVNGQSFGYQRAGIRGITFAEKTNPGWDWKSLTTDSQDRLRIHQEYRQGLRAVSRSVAISNGVVVAGDLAGEAKVTGQQGVVHFFEQSSAGAWKWGGLIQPDGPTEPVYGYSVAIDNNTVVATTKPFPHASQQPAAHFFERQPDGSWQESAKFQYDISTGGFGALFFEISGDTAIGRTENELLVYERRNTPDPVTGNLWEQTATLPQTRVNSLSKSATIDGNLIAVTTLDPVASAEYFEAIDFLRANPGLADVVIPERPTPQIDLYRRNASGDWQLAQSLHSPDLDYADTFGASLALDNGRLLIGAANANDQQNQPGAAFLFMVVPEPSAAALLTLSAFTCSCLSRSSHGRA